MPDVTPRIARAQPIPITLSVLRLVSNGGEDQPAVYEATDEVETVGVRFSANSLCDLEEQFGTVAIWQEGLDQRPYNTVRATIALLTGRPEAEIGEAMIETEWYAYMAALGEAFAIANGVDPTKASQIAQVVEWRRRNLALKDGEIPGEKSDGDASNERSATPGSTGSTPGQEPADLSTTSGSTRPRSSS